MRKSMLFCAITACLVCQATVSADTITFDPDGTGGQASVEASAFRTDHGNLLTEGANQAIAIFSTTGIQVPFDVYLQVRINRYRDGGSGLLQTFGGIDTDGSGPGGGDYELTAVAGFSEVVSSLNATRDQADFDFIANPLGPNFFEIYYDPTPDSSDLAGTGFNRGLTVDTDSVLILSGSVIDSSGEFGRDPVSVRPSSFAPLDQNDVDNYDGAGGNAGPTVGSEVGDIDSRTGGGFAAIDVRVNFADPNFFQIPVGSEIAFAFARTLSFQLPFEETDPSGRFLTTAGTTAFGVDPSDAGAGLGGASELVGLGPVNADDYDFGTPGNGEGGPDVQFQILGDASFTVVPEPASLTLLGLGAMGLIGVRRSRKQRIVA